MTSQKQVLSKLLHGDTLEFWPREQSYLLEDKAFEHMSNCTYLICSDIRDTITENDDIIEMYTSYMKYRRKGFIENMYQLLHNC